MSVVIGSCWAAGTWADSTETETTAETGFKGQMNLDLSVFFNTAEFAETIIYTAVGKAGVYVTALVDRGGSHQEPYVRGQVNAVASVTVKASEVTNPQHGDYFTFDDTDWFFDPEDGVTYYDDDVYIIRLERNFE